MAPRLELNGVEIQRGDWVKFRSHHPDATHTEGHALSVSRHGVITWRWAGRDVTAVDDPTPLVSTGLVEDFQPYLTDIWRRDTTGVWTLIASQKGN